jgi:alkanesulfonate monooxygenase
VTKSKLRVFPAIPRNPNAAKYIDELMRVARFSERNGLEGPLLFAGNDTLVPFHRDYDGLF